MGTDAIRTLGNEKAIERVSVVLWELRQFQNVLGCELKKCGTGYSKDKLR
jgi:hypothetical protein